MNLETGVRKWLDEQGFPFEMHIARELMSQEFDVTQSPYYVDFEEQKPRESDIQARLYGFYEPRNALGITEIETYCTIECKAGSKPWLIFKQARAKSWKTEAILTNIPGRKLLHKIGERKPKVSLLESASSSGYSAVLAHTESDRAFAALMSAMKAAEAKVRETLALGVDDSSLKHLDFAVFASAVVPVVATTAPIFECTLSQSGVELQQVSAGSVAFQYPRVREHAKSAAVVHIVSKDGWSDFMSQVQELHIALRDALPILIPAQFSSK